MENNLRKAYSEIYEILNLMEKEYIEKVPDKLKELFLNEKDNNFKPNINIDIPLENQGLQKDTLTILAILYLNYWCETEQEKQELIKHFDEVDKKIEEKYNIDNIFKKRGKNAEVNKEHVDTSLIEHKESFFKILINKIKSFFSKKSIPFS